MTSLEHMVRSFARRITQNGAVALVTDGQPALIAAFKDLGWSDPYPDPELLPKTLPAAKHEKAVVTAPERAVLSSPKGRIDGGL